MAQEPQPAKPAPAGADQPARKPVLPATSAASAPKQPELKHLVRIAKIDIAKKSGALSDSEVKRIEEIVKDPIKAGLPPWLINRRYDPETGQHKHLISGDLQFAIENDMKIMKKIKSYKGVRHILGQPVRGQRTRSNFRKNKGKVLGVRRSASAAKASGGKT